MEAYAVIDTGGKQYRVQANDMFDIELVDGEAGTVITLDRVLAVSNGSELVVGAPTVAGASVTAEIVAQHRGPKVVAFKKNRRKGFHKKIGHRQELTKIRVKEIKG
ncbi:MAG TPA: 50S ribosomal protein L21 [Kiritimatiellia bacterium]|nr:50S ribosomal protein L21 [Kiritimatiellia bacterium]HMP00252.1 50S ribosomal protein L21 [Kiritimatiellia bacterium]HMP97843.1 50S ribosomal protein L21 [Kiritimatiellia bacterium]